MANYTTELAHVNISEDPVFTCLLTDLGRQFLPLFTRKWASIATLIVGHMRSVVERLPRGLSIHEYFFLPAAYASLMMPSQLADVVSASADFDRAKAALLPTQRAILRLGEAHLAVLDELWEKRHEFEETGAVDGLEAALVHLREAGATVRAVYEPALESYHRCFWLFDRLVYMLCGVELESAWVYFRKDLACLFAAESGVNGDERLASAIAAAKILGYL